ncbi:MAG: carbon monoxide dehydrogenase subunit G [Betaproteobacteria bacterium]|nr:carbon monoxide dehydrogenase subunit G [Betaproteobacteria bacterium]
MDMNGSRALAVTQQQAWDALNDPAVLQACIPGCDKLERTGDDQYAVSMQLKIGPVSARFNGKIALSDVQAPASYTLAFEGQGGGAGFGKGQSKVSLAPQDGGCLLSYSVHAQVGGKVAQLGQRLIDGAAKSMADDFFKRFDAEMQRLHPEAYAARAASGAAAEATAAGGKVPAWAWAVGAVVVLAVAYWLLRR